MSIRVLFVGVEDQVIEGYRRQCHGDGGLLLESAPDGSAGLERVVQGGTYAVIVADMRMAGVGALEFLKAVSEQSPHSVRMMLIDSADLSAADAALHAGDLFRFMCKPCPPETMVHVLHAGLAQYRLLTAERELLEKTLTGTISILVEVLSHSEPALFARGKRLQEYVHAVAGLLEYQNRWELEIAALLSQIGGLTIPAEILLKERARHALSEQEQALLARIPESGSNLLARIPRLETVAQIVRYQHAPFESLDSSEKGEIDGGDNEQGNARVGMPAGGRIPRGARILKVLLDLIDLEATHTCRSVALRLMRSRPGTYDPQILEALIAHYAEVLPTDGEEKPSHPLPRPVGHSSPKAPKVAPCSAPYRSMPIPFAELVVGDLLTADIQTVQGFVLLPAGSLVTALTLEKLRNHVRYQGVREPLQIAVEDAPNRKPVA